MPDTYKPTSEMASAAKRAIRWIEEGHAGGGFTATGRRRASQLAGREALSLETVKRMYSFFSRHEVDKKGKDFDNLTKPSPGRVAWDAWGGDAGFAWSKRIVNSMSDKAFNPSDASAFFGITKSEKQADGTLLVTGIATDDSLDVDEQICDPEWLKTAMPDWFRWGNIREQHSNIAAGVATEYETKGSEHWITARVVDPSSIKKVESGVLKGFSVGIRAPRVVKDNKAAGGRIVDGQIVEVSLVDRPANPSCTLSLAKTIDGTLTPVEEIQESNMSEKAPKKEMTEESAEESTASKMEESTEESTAKKAMEESTEESTKKKAEESTEESTAKKAAEESTKMCKECGKAEDECKCDEGGFERKAAKKPAEESSQKPGEESSQRLGEESSRPGGVAGIAGKADQLTRIEEMLTVLLDTQKEIAKAINNEEVVKSVQEVAERLDVVEKSAKATPPARTRVSEAEKPSKKDEDIAKANELRVRALNESNPAIAKGFLTMALEIEKNL